MDASIDLPPAPVVLLLSLQCISRWELSPTLLYQVHVTPAKELGLTVMPWMRKCQKLR